MMMKDAERREKEQEIKIPTCQTCLTAPPAWHSIIELYFKMKSTLSKKTEVKWLLLIGTCFALFSCSGGNVRPHEMSNGELKSVRRLLSKSKHNPNYFPVYRILNDSWAGSGGVSRQDHGWQLHLYDRSDDSSLIYRTEPRNDKEHLVTGSYSDGDAFFEACVEQYGLTSVYCSDLFLPFARSAFEEGNDFYVFAENCDTAVYYCCVELSSWSKKEEFLAYAERYLPSEESEVISKQERLYFFTKLEQYYGISLKDPREKSSAEYDLDRQFVTFSMPGK